MQEKARRTLKQAMQDKAREWQTTGVPPRKQRQIPQEQDIPSQHDDPGRHDAPANTTSWTEPPTLGFQPRREKKHGKFVWWDRLLKKAGILVVPGWLLYMVSLFLSLGFTHRFLVLGIGEIFFLILAFAFLPVIITSFTVQKAKLVAALHLFLAVFMHPEVSLTGETHYYESSQQFALLRKTNELGEDIPGKIYAAEELATSLGDDALWQFKRLYPFLYWAYPPSLVLLFWGAVAYFFIPDTSRKNRSED